MKPFNETLLGKIVKGAGQVLVSATGGKTNGIVAIATELISDSKGNKSSKRIIKLIGGSLLITTGVGILASVDYSVEATEIMWKSINGLVTCGLGVTLAILMKSKDPS